jgi:CRP-like cAMP-binding protein
MPQDLLDRILGEIHDRKEASRAARDESRRLERALAALEADDGRGRAAERPRRRSTARRRRPRAAPGANRDAILAVVGERPGVTAGELASTTGISRATVSSTVARLAAGGTIERIALPGGGAGFRRPRSER